MMILSNVFLVAHFSSAAFSPPGFFDGFSAFVGIFFFDQSLFQLGNAGRHDEKMDKALSPKISFSRIPPLTSTSKNHHFAFVPDSFDLGFSKVP